MPQPVLIRECDQCGWKPSPQWTSERCGSYPFGSCDGTVSPAAREAGCADAVPTCADGETKTRNALPLSLSPQGAAPNAIQTLVSAVNGYLDHLHSDKPLNDEFKNHKGRVITAACIVAAPYRLSTQGAAPDRQTDTRVDNLK